jgi:hypothetical protein
VKCIGRWVSDSGCAERAELRVKTGSFMGPPVESRMTRFCLDSSSFGHRNPNRWAILPRITQRSDLFRSLSGLGLG